MCDQAMQLKPNAGMADEEIAVKLFKDNASNSRSKCCCFDPRRRGRAEAVRL